MLAAITALIAVSGTIVFVIGKFSSAFFVLNETQNKLITTAKELADLKTLLGETERAREDLDQAVISLESEVDREKRARKLAETHRDELLQNLGDADIAARINSELQKMSKMSGSAA
jgi:septal ring factor EnvC (AmiA/AmiB activator)